jgi:hypothetical protein
MENVLLFIFLNFSLGFASDIVLNDLSTHYGIFKSLKPYFQNESIIKNAFAAGLTIVSALVLTMIISHFIFGFSIPNNTKSLLLFCILAFIIGYAIDYFIYKMKIFGNRLDIFYKEAGVGFWGAISFIFAIIISYVIQKYLFKKD